MASSATIEAALARFLENESRLNDFMNALGTYATNETVPRNVETVVSLMERLQTRYLTIVSRGDWATLAVYAINDVAKELGNAYLCVEGHTAGTFATDLAAGKWIVYQGLTGPIAAADIGNGEVTNDKLAGSITNAKLADAILAAGVGGAAAKTVGAGALELPTSNQIYGPQSVWIPGGAITGRKSNGAASNSFETATNKMTFATLDYDPAAVEYGQFTVRMPKSWDTGSFTAAFVWSHTTGTGGVAWGIQARAISDTDALDGVFGTQVTVNDTGGIVDTLYITGDSGAIVPSGTPAAQDTIQFQVSREVADVNDTLNVDARLHGILLIYTSNALNDA